MTFCVIIDLLLPPPFVLQSELDATAGMPGVPQVLEASGVGVERAQTSVAEYVRFVMASDRKLGPMKSLQVSALTLCNACCVTCVSCFYSQRYTRYYFVVGFVFQKRKPVNKKRCTRNSKRYRYLYCRGFVFQKRTLINNKRFGCVHTLLSYFRGRSPY